MPAELALAAVIGTALCLYFLLGGADFGGGVWDLLATGPRAAAQRRAVEDAIGPVWEVNHVWLILVVVVLFTGFPAAFAAISVAMHVPLTLFLIGVVLRGSAFAFRGVHAAGRAAERRLGLVFSIASLVAPVLLGMVVGALVSGRIRVEDAIVTSGFFAPWLAPFPVATGLFALALCAYLAATYLTVEVHDPALREDFRHRDLGAGIAVGALALAAFLLSRDGAPRVHAALLARRWSWPFHALTAAAAAQTAFILLGWGLAQLPFLVVPDLTLADAAASPPTLRLLLIVLAAGVPVLVPSLVLLFRVFTR